MFYGQSSLKVKRALKKDENKLLNAPDAGDWNVGFVLKGGAGKKSSRCKMQRFCCVNCISHWSQ
jgi:hypothetical protein